MTIEDEKLTSRQEYRDMINALAAEVESKVEVQGRTRDDISPQRIAERTVDDDRHIIMTALAANVLLYAKSDPAEFKHLISDGDSTGRILSVLAYNVVLQDLDERIRERGNIEAYNV